MRGVESGDKSVEERSIYLTRRRCDPHFHGLAAVTDIRLAQNAHARWFDAIARQGLDRLAFEAGVERGDGGNIDCILVHHARDDVIAAPV
ncbi:MAG: hypothetical protein E6G96_16805, partial [Alphaproteobacteria bacterium]